MDAKAGQGNDREAARRAELGGFLRAHRARITPEAAHLGRAGRRRTPGLRREEVAVLAGISSAWYTWLEQGREIRVSPEVLHRIADALQLTAEDRRHLLALADPGFSIAAPPAETVTPALQRVLRAMPDVPAAIIGRYGDLLAASPALEVLLPPAGGPGEERNLPVFVFTNRELRERLSDWESLARECVAHFRSVYRFTVGEPKAEHLVARLRAASPEFAAWWDRYELDPTPSGPVVLDHPTAGHLMLEHVHLLLSTPAALTLGVLTPVDEATRRRIRRMVGAAARRHAARRRQ